MFFLICLIGFALNANLVFAQEVEYPEIPGADTPSIKGGIPNYVKYIFNFAIWASGFIALCVLIYGGFKYLTSVGSPEKIQDAKEQISAALLGMLILFCSYLILVKINPQLVVFHLSPIPPPISTLKPGVLVCKEPEPPDIPVNVTFAWDIIERIKDPNTSIEDKRYWRDELEKITDVLSKYCYYIVGGSDVRKDFNNKIKYVYLIPEEGEENITGPKYTNYGAILYEDEGFGDKAKVIVHTAAADEPYEEIINTGEIKVSSIRPFVLTKPEDGHRAVLYEEIDYNFGGDPAKKTIPLVINSCSYGSLDFTPQSIEIVGNYIVILSTELRLEGESEVFIEPGYRDLNNNRVACWGWHCKWYGVPYYCKISCVKSTCTYGAKLY